MDERYVKHLHDKHFVSQVSRHVDHTGRIYLPYLHEWNEHNSDLLGLVQICIITFGEQPPVYARPAGSAATQPPPPMPQMQPAPGMQTSGTPYPPPQGQQNQVRQNIDPCSFSRFDAL